MTDALMERVLASARRAADMWIANEAEHYNRPRDLPRLIGADALTLSGPQIVELLEATLARPARAARWHGGHDTRIRIRAALHAERAALGLARAA